MYEKRNREFFKQFLHFSMSLTTCDLLFVHRGSIIVEPAHSTPKQIR